MQTGWLAAEAGEVWVGAMAGVAWAVAQKRPLAGPAGPASQTAAAGGLWAAMLHAWPGPAAQIHVADNRGVKVKQRQLHPLAAYAYEAPFFW
jgi:hypothetical protein